jgi:hypothetical protein
LEHGRFTPLDYPDSTFTAALDINNLGVVGGRYFDADGVSRGFTWRDGRFTQVDFPGSVDTRVRGIDDFGRLTGNYRFDDDVEHGFLIDRSGSHTIDVPESIATNAWDINVLGWMVGRGVGETDGIIHGFLLVQGSFTQIDFPDIKNTRPLESIPRATSSASSTTRTTCPTVSFEPETE